MADGASCCDLYVMLDNSPILEINYQDWTQFDDATSGKVERSIGSTVAPDVLDFGCAPALYHDHLDVCRHLHKSHVRQDEVGLFM